MARRVGHRAPGSGDLMAAPKLSVVIPAYNEEESIGECVREVCSVMDRLGQTYEVVVVDDGSTDSTPERLCALRPQFAALRVVRILKNSGETAATDAGFRAARGELIATVDADLQNDPADIPKMVAMMNDWDVVCGVRAKREDSFVRRVSSRAANWLRNKLTRESITDVGCTMKVVRASYAKKVKLFTGMHRFLPTLLRMEGARVTEVPVHHRPRLKGRSKYGVWNRLFRGLYDLFGVRWMQSRWLRYESREER
jgi:glycosyltransferase involved in cell wall biosynthesis